MNTDDQRAYAQLDAIKRIATLLYPYPNDSKTDDALLLTLGEIAGLAMTAMARYDKAHPEERGK